MYSQVQLYYNGDDYFIADQIFVKYKKVMEVDVVDDILVLENKLSSTTPLTSPQSGALKSSGYRVRNERREPVLGNENLIKNTELRFSKDIQWYKVYDGTDGKAIQNIINIK